MKRVVTLTWKNEEQDVQVFKTVRELSRQHGNKIGITLGSLWNALSKRGGVYENSVCKIEYKSLS